ncbi:UDP-N-acetylglucosamine pyrophosphorylase [Mucor velutinosus]|uniref:UDP-N-acetylglucosamine pyrophosphorylase n=1 Tax=Mucor velutinosus TaxID=708070 RepID=A0AAN7D1Z0_9FUNG|nr:UDP-N-acetylglucosamine pyrophosphorylase [Mucor velutinosus]
MIEPCKFIFTQQALNSPFHLVSIMNHLLGILLCYHLDSLITLYHTQYPFFITPSDVKDTIVHEPAPTMPRYKKPNLHIDTTNDKDVQLSQSRYHPQSAYPDVPQLLFSPTSSISSFGSSNYHWSPDDSNNYAGSKRSQVEDMVHLFENGHRYMEQHRRHSVDSHWSSSRKRIYIRERRYEYQPTVGEWNRRIENELLPMQLSGSKSTPIQPSKRKMTPIMETSKSLWA